MYCRRVLFVLMVCLSSCLARCRDLFVAMIYVFVMFFHIGLFVVVVRFSMLFVCSRGSFENLSTCCAMGIGSGRGFESNSRSL